MLAQCTGLHRSVLPRAQAQFRSLTSATQICQMPRKAAMLAKPVSKDSNPACSAALTLTGNVAVFLSL
eukprot:1955220-Amphidinium_carterae.1